MAQILIFVAGNPKIPLSGNIIEEIRAKLSSHNVNTSEPLWLHDKKATEINTPYIVHPDRLHTLRKDYLDTRQIDVFSIPQDPSENRRKKLLLADMDATIVEGETLDELAREVGLKDKISAITERAMRGELDFHAALTERVRMLENLPVSALQKTLDKMVMNKGAEDVVRVMRKFGAECYLVSGGFTFFTENIGKVCGFNGHHGNTLEIIDEKLTGRVIPPILDKDAKLAFLQSYTRHIGLDPNDTMAVGDGANDIPMLKAAGLGVGFHPKPAVKENLENNIIHTDLTSLLYIQGYIAQEIYD